MLSIPHEYSEDTATASRSSMIGPSHERVTFVMTGKKDVFFTPHGSPNVESCPSSTKSQCNLGIKPFVAAL